MKKKTGTYRIICDSFDKSYIGQINKHVIHGLTNNKLTFILHMKIQSAMANHTIHSN